jgi:hypothetical protein
MKKKSDIDNKRRIPQIQIQPAVNDISNQGKVKRREQDNKTILFTSGLQVGKSSRNRSSHFWG